MKKALVIYGSELGNTKAASEIIAATLRRGDLAVDVKNVVDADIKELLGPQDITLLGCSTWGAVDAEVQHDFVPFFEAMADVDLTGKRMAIFGCGDSGWDVFCRAVIAIEARAKERGAMLLADSLKIDGHPKGVQADVEKWAAMVAERAQQG